ncbi:FACT complex subunit spt16 [Yamadazyma tenuis]|uniref:FACT complex subunit spt16 n=1 Tax=Candida tenuis TaxID=2315449 RepID=UPI0027A00491|nr:FACT complex subunit spt16 [Yamadazyma tenuis]
MSEINIDANQFHKRLSIIQQNLTSDVATFSSLAFLVGGKDDDNTYKKPTVLQTWLLGYEFPHTGIFINQNNCYIITSEGKAKHITHLTDKPTPNSSNVEILIRNKDAEHNKAIFSKVVAILKDAGAAAVGQIEKAKYKGKFIEEWQELVKDDKDLKFADCTLLLSKSMESKDDEEIDLIKLAAKSSMVMLDLFSNEMMKIVDEETKISHAKLSDQIENRIDNPRWFAQSDLGKRLLSGKVDPDQIEWCYNPIIQSGREFDLKPSAQSNNKNLVGDGAILCSIGLRYRNYCSNIGRTFLINPTKQMDTNFEFLLKLQNALVSDIIKVGKSSSEIYHEAIKFIETERPDLVSHFTKNCGWLMGIEFRDSSFLLNAKSNRKIQKNQIFSLAIGFNDLTNETTKHPYALLLNDTIQVTESEVNVLSNHLRSKPDVSFYFKENDIKDELDGNESKLKSEKDIKTERKLGSLENNSKILKQKLRNESTQNEDNLNQEQIRRETQSKLHEKRLQEGLSRFSKADATDESDYKPIFKKYDSYIRESQIPSNVRDLKIHVDYKNQTIILPVCGRPVPFHINSFKNGSQNEEGDFTYLRLNFNSPGSGGAGSKKQELPYEDNPDNTFIRSFTFRSRDRQRMVDVYKAIQDLKKDSMKREQERKQLEDVVTQASLIELKGSRSKRLENVLLRPQLDSKKAGGVLSIHENGLRYQSSFKLEQKVDILFSNIKHLFFQPCKDELIVLIHCHLVHPIMIGKSKKTYDIQFYREASDIAFDETGGRKRKYRYGDEDELQQEQEERRRKAALDKEFKNFAQLIADSSHGRVDLDIPFRELGFQGVPFRSAVLCMPTRDCLVQLIDPPYLVITLEEIEIAHLERVQFGLKNFDLVFVFKDLNKPVVHINTIPMELIEDVKNWLTDVDIPISEGQMNLNWPSIMKTVLADPYQFFVDGGWSFLTGTGESSDEEEEDEESEFEASDDDPSDEEVVSEGEDDYSEAGSDSGSGSEDVGEESDGDDWDEMEKKAAREDQNRYRD